MDELIIYLRLLHMYDQRMQKLFVQGGAEQVAPPNSPVSVRQPDQRLPAVYPGGTISGDENGAVVTGEALPKFINTTLRIEWRTRLTNNETDHLQILQLIKERSWALMQGKAARPALTFSLPGRAVQKVAASPEVIPSIINTRVGGNFQVVWCQQVNPTRGVPTLDQTIAGHLTTYEITLSRYNL